MEELLHYLAYQNMEYRHDRVHEQISGQLYGGRPAPDRGDDDIRGVTLMETLKPLKRCGQVEFGSWVCRRCGYPNPLGLAQCRGYLDAPRGNLDRDIPWWYSCQRDRGRLDEHGRTRCVFVSTASAYGRGTNRIDVRWRPMRADDPRLLPVCGIEEGYFVVLCNGTEAQRRKAVCGACFQ